MSETTSDDVRVRTHGGVGRITLDRPKAMNALTAPMVQRVAATLKRWRHDDGVRVVVIDGAGERGLCAGGDLKLFHRSARDDGSGARAFFAAEYAMNAVIGAYPKPIVALMFGTVLGGGVGISAHASHRLVHENSGVGMPEVGIGFVPDVGGTWLLGRAPGELGLYLALTGLSAGAADTVRCGLADAVVGDDVLAGVRAAPDARDVLAITAAATARDVPAGELAADRPWIDECFAAPTAGAIVERLHAAGRADTAELIASRSPESVELTLLAVRRARTLPSLEDALAMEYRISADSLTRHDFVEGIRAQVIDKDRAPRWRPSTLAEVDVPALARRFAAVVG